MKKFTHHLKNLGSLAASEALGTTTTSSSTLQFSIGKRPSSERTQCGTQFECAPLPRVSPALLSWFTWYSRRYIRRHFHSLRISRSGLPPATCLPLVIYSNHASWWDPLVGLFLKSECFAKRTLFTPLAIEAQAREPDDFQVVLRGGSGQGGIYDWWRSLRARWQGEAFTQQHGQK